MTDIFRFFLTYSLIKYLTGGRGLLGFLLIMTAGWFLFFLMIPIVIFFGLRGLTAFLLLTFIIIAALQ